MIFDKNQKSFPSESHKAVWDTALHILPLESTLPQEIRAELPSYMAKSCEQLQKYFLYVLGDVYENPEIYEPFQYQHRRLGVQHKFMIPFADFGIAGEAGEDYLSVNRSVFDKLFLKQTQSKIYHRSGKITLTVEQRKEIFERTGLKIEYDGNNAVLTNEMFPNMFYAMREMALAAVKEKGSGDNSFTYCDFRKLCKEYKYDRFENALIFLNDEHKSIAEQLDAAAKKLKLSRSVKSGHCPGYNVSYKHKKTELMEFNCMGNDLAVSIRFIYDAEKTAPIYRLFDAVENDSDELKKFVYSRLHRCFRCNHNCSGYADTGWGMQIYGKPNRMCIYIDRMGIHMPSRANGKDCVKSDEIPMIEKILLYAKNLADEML